MSLAHLALRDTDLPALAALHVRFDDISVRRSVHARKSRDASPYSFLSCHPLLNIPPRRVTCQLYASADCVALYFLSKRVESCTHVLGCLKLCSTRRVVSFRARVSPLGIAQFIHKSDRASRYTICSTTSMTLITSYTLSGLHTHSSLHIRLRLRFSHSSAR